MRDLTFRIKAETELNSDEKRRLSELAEAFVFQAQKYALGAGHNLGNFSSTGSLDSALKLDLWEPFSSSPESKTGCPEHDKDAATEYEIGSWFCSKA